MSVDLPPFARGLDVRFGWPAFAAGALGPEPNTPEAVAADAAAVDTESDPAYGDDVGHATEIVDGLSEGHKPCPTSTTPLAEYRKALDDGAAESGRLAFLRRVQHVDPRERRP